MKFKILLYVFTLVLVNSNDNESESNQLITMNKDIYTHYVSSQNNFFVFFHNPWCKWSQDLEKNLLIINDWLKYQNQPYFFGEIDVTLNDVHDLIKQNIPDHIMKSTISYPKLLYYKDGNPIEIYNGRLNKTTIYNYIKRKLHPDSEILENMYKFKAQLDLDKKAFVLFSENDEHITYYNSLARYNTEYIFYHVNDNELINNAIGKNDNMTYFSYYSNGKENQRIMVNTKEDISNFFKKHTFKNYNSKFDEDMVNEVFMKKRTAVILFRNIYDNKTMNLEESLPMLSTQEKEMLWIVTDLTGKYELKLAKLLGVNIDSLPTIRIIDFKNGFRRYELSRELKIENVLNFIRMYKKGDLTPYYTQESTQEKSLSSKVKRISSSNYYESVIFNKKNVLVFFHTYWCGNCKKISPILDILADKYKNELFSIVMIDLEQNDLMGIKINKVPSFYLYTIKDKENPFKFEEENINLKSLMAFIDKNTYMNIKSDL